MSQLLTQFPPQNFVLLALILGLPALGAFVNGVFGKRIGNDGVRTLALWVMGLAFAASVVTFGAVIEAQGQGINRLSWEAWHWFDVENGVGTITPINVKFSVDALSATMMLVITGVGFLIHLYSTSYMKDDPGYFRFFAYLNLFIFSMLTLVMGDNLVVLFVGWEGVGLCSYLLIGFWYTDSDKAAAGKKAFITNRIGDFGLLVAMAMLLKYEGTLDWAGLENQARVAFGGGGVGTSDLVNVKTLWPLPGFSQAIQAWPSWLGFLKGGLLTPVTASVASMVGMFLFLGCAGKSAQVPLYVWLPDAMAGPTPVSALIHAATMVTAGVYLVARMSFLFVLSPATMALIAATGAFTALLAATIALSQHDLKKVLAYSTVSQLGFMFVGVGSGGFSSGFFHVLTHAFFKACLFLGAGSVIHAMHAGIHDDEASQDMRNMGGLAKYMPRTRWTFLAACVAIAGVPLTSGFFSKDEILAAALHFRVTPRRPSLWAPPEWFGAAIFWVCVIAAAMTAFYMFRAYFKTFHGEFKGWTIVSGRALREANAAHDHDDHDDHHDEPVKAAAPQESPWQITVPLMVLAGLSLVAGVLNVHPLHFTPLENFLAPVLKTALASVDQTQHSLLPMIMGTVAGLGGIGAAYYIYMVADGKPAEKIANALGPVYRWSFNKWYVDEFYENTAVGLVDGMADTAAQFDKWVIDGILARVTAAIVTGLGTVLRLLQGGRVQVYAASMMLGLLGVGWFVFQPHAIATENLSQLRNGQVKLTAAPGHGYSYRWSIDDKPKSEKFDSTALLSVALKVCESKKVTLEAKNAFGRVGSETYQYCRDTSGRGAKCCNSDGTIRADYAPPKAKPLPKIGLPGGLKPGVYDADILKKLIPGTKKGGQK